MPQPKDQPVDEQLHQKAENLAYWMYESSGNSKYVLAGRKPLHPDEATKMIEELCQAECNRARKVTGETSDGYHTFNELYDYRRAYNAALFNEWAAQGKYDVHKSLRHSDGELCFGGGWFVVVAELPTGQITNHYEDKYYDEFQFIERERANQYDGHTPQEALERLQQLMKEEE